MDSEGGSTASSSARGGLRAGRIGGACSRTRRCRRMGRTTAGIVEEREDLRLPETNASRRCTPGYQRRNVRPVLLPIRVTRSVPARYLRGGARRPSPFCFIFGALSGGDDPFGCNSLFHPGLETCHRGEAIRSRATRLVAHTRDQKQPKEVPRRRERLLRFSPDAVVATTSSKCRSTSPARPSRRQQVTRLQTVLRPIPSDGPPPSSGGLPQEPVGHALLDLQASISHSGTCASGVSLVLV